jgi:hypothetical protein
MDYTGNTNKDRDKEKIPEKKIEKVVTGEVINKPKPVGRKFKDIFFGGNLTTASKFVIADIFYPALRNLVWDMISEGSKRVIFGEGRAPYHRPFEYRPRVSYNNPIQTRSYSSYSYPRDPRDPRDRANLPDQPNRWRPERPNNVNEIILANKSDAENVVEGLIDIIEKYEVASLADLYDLIGLPTSPVDNKWGWTYLRNIEIRQVRDGYLIDLPQLEAV